MKLQKFNWLFLTSLAMFCSCGGGGGSSESPSEPIVNDLESVSTSSQSGLLASSCGVIEGGQHVNPAQNRISISAEAIDSDTLVVSRLDASNHNGQELVKLHGVTSVGVHALRRNHGISLLNKKLASGAFMVEAGKACDFSNADGGQGKYAQVFSSSGESMAELMLSQGAVVPESQVCSGDILASCYQTISVDNRPPSDVELELQNVSIISQCGAVKEGQLLNPVTKAEIVDVSAINSDIVRVTRRVGIEAGKSQLVKLHGVSSAGASSTAATLGKSFINSSLSAGAYLVVESQSCNFDYQGQMGVVGQLYTLSGISINEELVKRGYAKNTEDFCNGHLISQCFASLSQSSPEIGNEASSETINWFLWKPSSERDGNLAILINPENISVVVSGNVSDTLTNFGPSNGRGTTARAGRSGCSYGSNVKVEFYDSKGRKVYLANGKDSVRISNGCDRVEFRL